MKFLQTHKDAIVELVRAHNAKIEQEQRAAPRTWYEANRERALARTKKYQKDNPEKVRALYARYRARKRNAPVNDLTALQWLVLSEVIQNRFCAYCGFRFEKLTQEHMTPLSRGGSHTITNIVGACRSCNCSKHTNTAAEFVERVYGFTVEKAVQPC